MKQQRRFREDDFDLDALKEQYRVRRDRKTFAKYQKTVKWIDFLIFILVIILAFYLFNVLDSAIGNWRTKNAIQNSGAIHFTPGYDAGGPLFSGRA